MAKFVNHSIRLEEPMLAKLKLRAALHRRSFNGELVYMLNKQMEASEASDLQAAQAVRSANFADPPSGR